MIINEETIEFESVDEFALFTRYNAKNTKSIPPGYFLAEDMVNETGGILYTKGSDFEAMKVTRLKKIVENSPTTNPKVIVDLNDNVIAIERGKIHFAAKSMIDTKKSRSEYNKMMSLVQNMLEPRWNNILQDKDIVLMLSELKFSEDKTKKSKINPYYNHNLNTLLFSVGALINVYYVTKEKFKAKDYDEIALVALLVNIGGWKSSGDFLEKSVEQRKEAFIEGNKSSFELIKNMKVSDNVKEAVEFCSKFENGDKEFLTLDTMPAKFAQIVCIARIFDEMISGLWDQPKTPREVVDKLYVMATAKELPKLYVDSIAKSLQFDNLFDFYHELEMLIGSCKRSKGAPYPMTGFKSPIIFVCTGNMYECKEYVASAKSITIFKEIGGLPEGSYGRCEGLASRLTLFYDDHYREIKDEVNVKESGNNRGADDSGDGGNDENADAGDTGGNGADAGEADKGGDAPKAESK